jgi:hypothetical protein
MKLILLVDKEEVMMQKEVEQLIKYSLKWMVSDRMKQ